MYGWNTSELLYKKQYEKELMQRKELDKNAEDIGLNEK